MALLYNKQCVICGTYFKPRNRVQITCGSKICQNEYTKRVRSPKKHGLKDPMKGLTMDAIAANNLGMTYGQYKGAQWCRNKQVMSRISPAYEFLG